MNACLEGRFTIDLINGEALAVKYCNKSLMKTTFYAWRNYIYVRVNASDSDTSDSEDEIVAPKKVLELVSQKTQNKNFVNLAEVSRENSDEDEPMEAIGGEGEGEGGGEGQEGSDHEHEEIAAMKEIVDNHSPVPESSSSTRLTTFSRRRGNFATDIV